MTLIRDHYEIATCTRDEAGNFLHSQINIKACHREEALFFASIGCVVSIYERDIYNGLVYYTTQLHVTRDFISRAPAWDSPRTTLAMRAYLKRRG